MIAHNIPVAVATDFNPGSCPSLNMGLCVTMAYLKYRMTPEEILSAPTRDLLEYFMNSDFMKNRAASGMLKSAPRETDDMDYSCHRAFCELISRADFVECLEDYARSLPEDCSINYFSSPGTALAKVLKQPSVKKIVDEAISAAA